MKRWLVKDKDGKVLTVWGYRSAAILSAIRIPGSSVIEEWSGRTIFVVDK